MTTARMTKAMLASLEVRLGDLDARIAALDSQREGDDSVESTALLMQLATERARIADALQDARLIDDDPFDVDAIEVGDLVTIMDNEGTTDSYVLVDEGVGARARSDWVSVGSPLGGAIVGRGKGDSVEVDSPQGPLSYVVVDFVRASEAALMFATTDGFLPSEAFLG
jgi:transcription elongation GreA/GreB family factor